MAGNIVPSPGLTPSPGQIGSPAACKVGFANDRGQMVVPVEWQIPGTGLEQIMTATTDALEFMYTRRSYPTLTISPPVPTREQVLELIRAAARVPDHGKLEPWRFIVIERSHMGGIAAQLKERGLELGKAESLVEKAADVFSNAGLVVAVVGSPDNSAKIPAIEQKLSAGAACLSLLNAALASGWAASWVTGFGAHDQNFREKVFGLQRHEFIAGFIHIGSSGSKPPERPRPDISAITEWFGE